MQDPIDKYLLDTLSKSQELIIAEINQQHLKGRFNIALELIQTLKKENRSTEDLNRLEKAIIKNTNDPSKQLEHWTFNKSNPDLYPKGILGTREAVQPLISLQRMVIRGLDELFSNPIDFACEISLIVRDDFESYLALKETIKHKLSTANNPDQPDLIAVELIFELYEEQTDPGSARLLRLLSNTHPWQTARIMRTQKLKKTSAYITSLARKFINNSIDSRDLTDLQKTNLIAISYPVLSHIEYKQLCASMADDAANYDIETVGGWTKTWITAALNGSDGNTFGSNTPKKLNIALCVSGKLRGFKKAHATWKNLGLENHNVDTYVHTWNYIDIQTPDSDWKIHAKRLFKDPSFITSYIKLCDKHGSLEVHKLYPSIFSKEAGAYIANEKTLKDIYGENTTIHIDDESEARFSTLSNQDKTHYKTFECFKLATRRNKYYDLVIKIRPDIMIGEGTIINWTDVHESCYENSVAFSETPPLLKENIFIGDQIGVSTLDISKTYSECYLFHDHAKRQKIPGIPATRTDHYTLAWTLLLNGIKSEQLKSVIWTGLSDVEKLDNTQILDLIEQDIGSNSSNSIHQDLLTALGAR